MAKKWPTFMKKWELMEHATRQFGYPSNIAFKIKMMTSIATIFILGTLNINLTYYINKENF